MDDYSEYLAAHLFNEEQHVSYRQLSRALKVHSNLAKQMLYEFHRKQNAKKPGSVHATYLVTGIRKIEAPPKTNGAASQDGDAEMRSSPPLPSSSAPKQDIDMEDSPSFVRSVMLAKEEHLQQARDLYETISGIHIYTLETGTVKNLNLLTECNRKVGVEYATEDPFEAWKQYGTIQNPNVRRRTRRTAPPVPAALSDTKAKPSAGAVKKEAPTAVKTESRPSSAKGTPAPEAKKSTAKSSAPKRDASSIFKSFSKAAANPKKQESQSSAEASPAPVVEKEDQPMGGFSEDNEDDEDDMPTTTATKKAGNGKSKKERAAELQAMMEMEDEPKTEAESKDEDEEMEDVEETAAIDKPASKEAEQPVETVTVENGRRRGRRRVMKKKTVKDEEGYLVTREEAAWESFSEDEPPPKKIKVPPASSLHSSKGGSGAGGKKAAAAGAKKQGQGNLMSFFGKK